MTDDTYRSGGRYVAKKGEAPKKVGAQIDDGKGKKPNPLHADYPKPPLKEAGVADAKAEAVPVGGAGGTPKKDEPAKDATSKTAADGNNADQAKK